MTRTKTDNDSALNGTSSASNSTERERILVDDEWKDATKLKVEATI